ncbi:MAG: LpxL/LpxP family Kdo(2)-lipid IV(A) lauroyl/palmitoleoyl acyltransferase [Perlucidibaca sp.]
MTKLVRADDGLEWRWLHPRFWPAWLACLLIFLLAWLPWPVQRRLGAGLGWLAYRLIPRRVDDTRINLSLCFPELDDEAREVMVRDIFRQGGIGIFETANAWFVPMSWYRDRIRVTGAEHVLEASRQGRGVIILGAHYSGLDLNGAAASLCFPLQVIYRPQNNPVLDWLIRTRRRRTYSGQIDHADMRSLFKALKGGETVWTSVDQDFGLKQGVMAPFFGYPAATLTATSRMARINQSPVVFVHFFRNPDERSYTLLFTPPLQDYPSGDDVADATRMNQALEKLIRRAPTQYMWFHRRFKSRPPGEQPPYRKKRKQR